MDTKKLIINNIKILKQYQVAKKIKNKYLENSSFRSNLSRNNLPRIEVIIDLCKSFNIKPDDFFTKKLELILIFKEDDLESFDD